MVLKCVVVPESRFVSCVSYQAYWLESSGRELVSILGVGLRSIYMHPCWELYHSVLSEDWRDLLCDGHVFSPVCVWYNRANIPSFRVEWLAHFTGMFLTSSLFYRSFTGDGTIWSVGISRKHNNTMSGTQLLDVSFIMWDFIDCTQRSARPFDCRYFESDMQWSNSHSFANCLNSVELKWGPLSLTTLSGIHCSPNIFLHAGELI